MIVHRKGKQGAVLALALLEVWINISQMERNNSGRENTFDFQASSKNRKIELETRKEIGSSLLPYSRVE